MNSPWQKQLLGHIHHHAISNACKHGQHDGVVKTVLGHKEDQKFLTVDLVNQPGPKEPPREASNLDDNLMVAWHVSGEHLASVSSCDWAWIIPSNSSQKFIKQHRRLSSCLLTFHPFCLFGSITRKSSIVHGQAHEFVARRLSMFGAMTTSSLVSCPSQYLPFTVCFAQTQATCVLARRGCGIPRPSNSWMAAVVPVRSVSHPIGELCNRRTSSITSAKPRKIRMRVSVSITSSWSAAFVCSFF